MGHRGKRKQGCASSIIGSDELFFDLGEKTHIIYTQPGSEIQILTSNIDRSRRIMSGQEKVMFFQIVFRFKMIFLFYYVDAQLGCMDKAKLLTHWY